MYIYVYIYIYIIYMKTVNGKTISVLISILLHTEDCVYRAVSKRCLFSLRVKKKTNQSLHSEKKKKSIKIQRLFWNSAACGFRPDSVGRGARCWGGWGVGGRGFLALTAAGAHSHTASGETAAQGDKTDTQEDLDGSSCHNRAPKTRSRRPTSPWDLEGVGAGRPGRQEQLRPQGPFS